MVRYGIGALDLHVLLQHTEVNTYEVLENVMFKPFIVNCFVCPASQIYLRASIFYRNHRYEIFTFVLYA